jgi:acid phosphatase family membrane protein YuiD
MKSGLKTTEFWFSAIAAILGVVMASGALPEGGVAAQIIGGVMAILGQLGYTAARAKVKVESGAEEVKVPAVTPPELP